MLAITLIHDSNKLDSIVDKYIDNGSQALLLVRLEDNDGNSIYQYSNKDITLVPDHEINEKTWFRIWSMSKIVTISLTMDLVEDGILKLDDPVAKYLEYYNDERSSITIRDLLDMSSGLEFPEHEHEKMFFQKAHIAYSLNV